MNDWISVKERLPEKWKSVLGTVVVTPEYVITEAMVYTGNGKWRMAWNPYVFKSEVTHWMPMPKPAGVSK